MSSQITVRLKGRMLAFTKDLVPNFKVISVPPDCSFASIRYLIGVAFHFPTDLDVKIYLDDRKSQAPEEGNMHRLARISKLAIEFDAEKSVFCYSPQYSKIFQAAGAS